MRKASDDLSLRPFASLHFDSQAYVRGVLHERRSEEVLAEVDRHIQGINEEINRYVSQRQRELVGGMQDVSALATQYTSMQGTAENLRRLASKLRQDAGESYLAVRSKTEELERMHGTAVVLRQLRQFVHVKTQLDHLLKRGDEDPGDREYDIRQLAAAARILHELECLADLPSLCKVSAVVAGRHDIDHFGKYIRHTAHKVLLAALRDQNAANLSSALQVFLHLGALPEVVLYAVDNTVKLVSDLVREVMDVSALAAQFPELGAKGAATRAKTAPKKGGDGQALRLALREMAQQFENIVYEYSAHMQAMQSLVRHREHASAPAVFLDALLASASGPFARHRGDILHVFWERLSASLQEVFHDKLKSNPAVVVRLYPSLRKAAVDVVDSFRVIAARESALAGGRQDADAAMLSVPAGDIFGCRFMSTSPTALGFGAPRLRKDDRAASAAAPAETRAKEAEDAEGGVVAGLGECRDRFLLEAQSRMCAPIALMFPELEGFVSAVPSKRDLSALLAVIKSELAVVVMEGEETLLRVLAREVCKAVRLLLAKIEGLVNTSVDVRRVAVLNGVVVRNTAQEHNGHIVALVQAMCEAVATLPVEVLKTAQDTVGAKMARSVGANEAFKAVCMDVLRTSVADACIALLESHLAQALLSATVISLAAFFNDVLVSLIAGDSAGALTVPDTHGSTVKGLDLRNCSRAARYLDWVLPLVVRAHLSIAPGPLLDAALEELCLRLLASYIGACSLVRPANDQSRARTLSDMALLQHSVCAQHPGLAAGFADDASAAVHPVVREFKCLRRLLAGGALSMPINSPSNLLLLKSEDVVLSLRPSTLLAYVVSMAPPQLPLVVDVGDNSPALYLSSLSAPPVTDVSRLMSSKRLFGNDSVACLYCRDPDALPSQSRVWSLVLQALDVFMQRAAVAEGAHKEQMRGWYEAVVDIGGHALSRDWKTHKI